MLGRAAEGAQILLGSQIFLESLISFIGDRDVLDVESVDSDPPDTVVALERQLALSWKNWYELDFQLEGGVDLWGPAVWIVAENGGLTLGVERSLISSGEPVLRRHIVEHGGVTTIVGKSWVVSVVVLEGDSEFVQASLEGLLIMPLVLGVGAEIVGVFRVLEALGGGAFVGLE